MRAPLELRAALEAGGVRLEPLSEGHRRGLAQAADEPEVWSHMPLDASGAGFDAWFDSALAQTITGREAVWAVRQGDGFVGATRYLAIEPQHRRLEIGHTWYAKGVWGTKVNPACKLALMRHAFETLDFNRVELKTDILNLRSQSAIAKLGAVREGVLRAHMVRRDGSLRDTVYFSILKDEWPSAKAKLTNRLAAPPP